MFNVKTLTALAVCSITWAQVNSQGLTDRFATTIKRYQKDNMGDGSFNYGYKTTNGISVHAKGYTKNPFAPPNLQISKHEGCYSYTSPEKAFVSVVYTADEQGYVPQTRITYPKDGLKHYQHLARPCDPSLFGSQYPNAGGAVGGAAGDQGNSDDQDDLNQSNGSSNGTAGAAGAELGNGFGTGNVPTGSGGCPNFGGCNCGQLLPPSSSFYLKDGSLVVINYKIAGIKFEPEVRVYPQGYGEFYTCPVNSPAIAIPVPVPSLGWGWGHPRLPHPYLASTAGPFY